jgi:cyanophycinase
MTEPKSRAAKSRTQSEVQVTAGTLALLGGGEFATTEEIDLELLALADVAEVIVLPTADAFEHPERAVARAQAWFEKLGIEARGLPVLSRPDASVPEHVEAIRNSRFTYVSGDSPMHLRSVLKATPAWDALLAAHADGGVVAASGPAAMAMCDPMTDPRGGAFTLGLGLARPMAVVPGAETWSHDRLHRTLTLGVDFPVVSLPTGSAVIRRPDGWTARGDVVVHLAGAPAGIEVLPRWEHPEARPVSSP